MGDKIMRLTCRMLKKIIGNSDNGFVYKGHNTFSGKPETRLDMSKLDENKRIKAKIHLWKYGLSLYQDDPVNNPYDYVVTF